MNYLKIDTADTCNGNGVRVVLWLSGCSHKCKGCQNPQTWEYKKGIEFNSKAQGALLQALSKDYIDGLTLSGGDPLNEHNVDDVYDLVYLIKNIMPEKTIWLYTGYTWERLTTHKKHEKRMRIIEMCDVLVDGRFVEELSDPTYVWAGSTNQKVIDVQKSLKEGQVVLWSI